jgi:hypothetical protein
MKPLYMLNVCKEIVKYRLLAMTYFTATTEISTLALSGSLTT